MAAEIGLTRERVVELRTASEQPVSLDAPMADDEEYHLADALEDISMTVPVDQTSHQAMRDNIDQALKRVQSPRRAHHHRDALWPKGWPHVFS